MEDARDCLYSLIDQNYERAVQIQRVWMKKIAEREVRRTYSTERNKEKTNYEFRIELSTIGFACRWVRIQFVKHGLKITRVVHTVAMPESGKYRASQFKHAEPWELELITQMEESLGKIRSQVKLLTKAHQSLIASSKHSEFAKPIQSVAIKHRVEPSPYSIKQFKSEYR